MSLRRAPRISAPGAALFLLLAACDESAGGEHWIDALVEDTAEQARAAQAAGAASGSAPEEDLDIDALLAEVEGGAAPAIPAPPPSSDWNELPLADGVFADRTGAGQYRHDVIEIPVAANGGALEYKLQMKAGDSIVYSWTAEGLSDAALLLSEFHGHTERAGAAPGDLMFYRREYAAAESGAMTAPFTGIHGWYLENRSDADITVVLDVAGFYDIVPDQAGTVR